MYSNFDIKLIIFYEIYIRNQYPMIHSHVKETTFFFKIAPLADTPMFNIKYFAMHRVQSHAGAIRTLLYG